MVGGGIVNIFIVVVGYNVGKFLYEVDFVEIVKKLMEECVIFVVIDVVCVKVFDENVEVEIKYVFEV